MLLSGIQKREQLLKMFAEALNEKRVEVVRCIPTTASAQRPGDEDCSHSTCRQRRDQPRSDQPVPAPAAPADGWGILWFTNDQARLKPQSLWLQTTRDESHS